MADFDEDLGQALRTLAADGRRGQGLDGAAHVRRVADRRQSRQRALGAAAAVAVLLVGGAVALNHNPSGQVTPAVSPTPTKSSPASKVPANAMLKTTDLQGAIIALSTPYPASVQAANRAKPDWPCAPRATSGAVARTAAFRTGTGSASTWIDQRVESFADTSSAASAMGAIQQSLTTCAKSTTGVTRDATSSETGVGDQAAVYMMTIPGDPNAHAVHEVWLEIAQTGRIVTWVGFEYYTQDAWPAQDIALRKAVARLCSLGGGACVKEPVVRKTTYETGLPGVDPSTLMPELLATTAGGHWTANVDETLDPPYACSPTKPDLGTPVSGEVIRSWESDLVDTYGTKIVRSTREVGEGIRPFASPAEAHKAVQAMTQALDQCTSQATEHVGTGLVWREIPHTYPQTWFAVAYQGSNLVTFQLKANGKATSYTATQINDLVAAALARLP
jgi:hypothetical protein